MFDFISYTSVRDIWIRYYDYEPDKMRTEKQVKLLLSAKNKKKSEK